MLIINIGFRHRNSGRKKRLQNICLIFYGVPRVNLHSVFKTIDKSKYYNLLEILYLFCDILNQYLN